MATDVVAVTQQGWASRMLATVAPWA